jgi:sugar/nucleoside kinase (ribokinase family)
MGTLTDAPAIVVAGHICLDLIPAISARRESYGDLLRPGKLLNVGAVVTSTGGAVANTGVALHRLGTKVRLVGKVGDDAFGRVILDILRRQGGDLPDHMVVDAASETSYTVVLSPPGLDRVFLHHPGANDTFTSHDVSGDHLSGARLLHFGYPPLMRAIYRDSAHLLDIFTRARAAGVITSLDMSNPDPDSESGRVDWDGFLRTVLPVTDVFMPSIEEIAFMLGRTGSFEQLVGRELLRSLADDLIARGAAIVGLKLGERGLYLRTTADAARLARLGLSADAWRNIESLSPCFHVNVVGATGSGDCTIAGFLAALVNRSTPDEAARMAVATGACNCEAPDATSGVPTRARVEERIAQGWQRHRLPPGSGFTWDAARDIAVPAN